MALVLLPGLVSVTVAGDSVKDALTKGKVNVDLRYRYEVVDQEDFTNDAQASTLRLRLGYTTGLYYGVFAMAEFDGIWVIGSERYNSTANELIEFPVVADPEGEELNQGYLGYRSLDMMTFKLGRQRIKLDNDRFIGNVGWRQNEQTYDALSGWFGFSDEFALFVGYIGNTNRVFGEDHPDQARADLNLDAPVLNISYDFPIGKLTGYGYFLEFVEAPMASNKSIGGRFTGSHAFTDKLKLLYTGEYADQSPWKDGASTNNASYSVVELGVGIKAVTLKAGYELLGGDGVYAFQTPLATGHAFNGWADLFLVTPLSGLEDTYFSAAATLKGIKLLGVYHSFAADTGSDDYGTEIDLRITKGFGKMYSVGAKYASYSADSGTGTIDFPGAAMPRPNVDVDKFWVWLGLKY
jgi:hypothetical protein